MRILRSYYKPIFVEAATVVLTGNVFNPSGGRCMYLFVDHTLTGAYNQVHLIQTKLEGYYQSLVVSSASATYFCEWSSKLLFEVC